MSRSETKAPKSAGLLSGIVISGVGGNYQVELEDGTQKRVKARGLFRKNGISPLIGDKVQVASDGFLETILPRKNELIRPAAANIDQVLVVFAVHDPEPHFRLLDRFLIEAERQHIPPVIVFNKGDLLKDQDAVSKAAALYETIGYPVFTVAARPEAASGSVMETEKLSELFQLLNGKLTVLAGPSGVGKSSLINALTGAEQEVGELSQKISRGKNTTRHARLLKVEGGGFIADTPGFTSFYTQNIPADELENYYPEFGPYRGTCRYLDCHHIQEPGCGIRQALEEGKIAELRYESYRELYQERKTYEKEHPQY